MTCTCKAELASILRDTGGPIGIAAWAKSVADRLSPAPAEPQEPCMVVEYPDGSFSIQNADGTRFWGPRSGKWQGKPFGRCGDFQSRAAAIAALPAARSALLAASEPWKAEAQEPCRIMEYDGAWHCYTHNKDWGAIINPVAPCDGWTPPQGWTQPKTLTIPLVANTPAAFDAAKVAHEMVGRTIPGGFDAGRTEKNLAAALTAAHEAGKAEAGQPRLRYEVLNAKKEVIAAFRDHYSATVFCNGLDGRSVVDTQPAPPAEKEPPHAN